MICRKRDLRRRKRDLGRIDFGLLGSYKEDFIILFNFCFFIIRYVGDMYMIRLPHQHWVRRFLFMKTEEYFWTNVPTMRHFHHYTLLYMKLYTHKKERFCGSK